jgi:phage major head subunit gpT-like protein
VRVQEAGKLIDAEITKVALPEEHAARVKSLFTDREYPVEEAGKAIFLTAVAEAVKNEHEFAKRLTPAPRVRGSGGGKQDSSMFNDFSEEIFTQIKEAGTFDFGDGKDDKKDDGEGKNDHVEIPTLRRPLVSYFERLREAGNSGDFSNLLGNVASKILIDNFEKGMANNKDWMQLVSIQETPDFKAVDVDILGQGEDLDLMYEDMEYKDSKVSDQKTTLQVKTYGKLFSISRKAVINDSLNALFGRPAKLGYAAARSLAKFFQTDLLEGTIYAYDSQLFFSTAYHGNLFTSGYTLTQANLEKQWAAMTKVSDTDSNQVGVMPAFLVHGPALIAEAARLCNSANLSYISSTTGYVQSTNPMYNKVKPVCLQWLTEHATPASSTWYLWADPSQFVGAMLAFLRGQRQPTVLMENRSAVVVGGAPDPYDIPFDRLVFKVRWDYGGQLVEPWAIQKNTV